MTQSVIFAPFLTMMIFTICVLSIVAARRAGDARNTGRSMNELPSTRQGQVTMPDIWSERTNAASDHLLNMFETPVLFYVLCLAFFITNSVTSFTLTLAWLYIALRFVHAFIHLTYNHVMHRFSIYLLSVLCLLTLIGQFAISIF